MFTTTLYQFKSYEQDFIGTSLSPKIFSKGETSLPSETYAQIQLFKNPMFNLI